MEIERKWILNRVPTEFKQIVHTQTEQLYLSTSPEVRLRHNPASPYPFRLTIKGEGTLTREEIQEEVSEDFFNEVKSSQESLLLRKIIISLIAADTLQKFQSWMMELLSMRRLSSKPRSRPAIINFLLMMLLK